MLRVHIEKSVSAAAKCHKGSVLAGNPFKEALDTISRAARDPHITVGHPYFGGFFWVKLLIKLILRITKV